MVDVEIIKKPYSSRIIDIYVKMIKLRYPYVDLDELVRHAVATGER